MIQLKKPKGCQDFQITARAEDLAQGMSEVKEATRQLGIYKQLPESKVFEDTEITVILTSGGGKHDDR